MGRSSREKGGPGFNTPFRELGKRLSRRDREARPEPGGPPAGSPSEEDVSSGADTEEAFVRAMRGVKPLANRDQKRAQPARPPARAAGAAPPDPDAEAYEQLSKFVTGEIPFDIADTDEYIEGFVEGFDRRVLRKLRRGEFSVQGHLDLHTMSRKEARAAVEKFVNDSLVAGHRCVLIVHGRGHHSPDQIPVLKNVLRAWLSRGRIGRAVLAFASARPVDGGAGALYVLLRRTR